MFSLLMINDKAADIKFEAYKVCAWNSLGRKERGKRERRKERKRESRGMVFSFNDNINC
jgi:hypothetical protein